MSTAPDFMPVLSAGGHDSPESGACVMEYVSLLAGEEWTDTPACTHPILAAGAQVVNDQISDDARHKLVPLISRLMGTAATGTPHEQKVLCVRLAAWAARQALHFIPTKDRPRFQHAVETAEAWADGRASTEDVENARRGAMFPTGSFIAIWASTAARFAAITAAEPETDAPGGSWFAVLDAGQAIAAGALMTPDDDLLAFLTGLLDEHDRLTGRVDVPEVTSDDLRRVAAHVG